MISVNGNNVLAFSASIDWDIQRIQARGAAMTGGLYNVTLRGSGYVAITTKGEPVALDVASAVFQGVDIAPGSAIPSDGDPRIDRALPGFLFTCGPDHIRHPVPIEGAADGLVRRPPVGQ